MAEARSLSLVFLFWERVQGFCSDAIAVSPVTPARHLNAVCEARGASDFGVTLLVSA